MISGWSSSQVWLAAIRRCLHIRVDLVSRLVALHIVRAPQATPSSDVANQSAERTTRDARIVAQFARARATSEDPAARR